VMQMWLFFTRRLRLWLLLSVALPLTRTVVHRLATAAERRDPASRSSRALRHADSAVTAASRRTRRSHRRLPRAR